jgi:hypothetical protein
MSDDSLDENATFLMSLHEHPQIAHEIGLFVGCYAGLELSLWALYSKIIDRGSTAAIALIGGTQSFAHKLAAIERFIEDINDPNKDSYSEIFAAARKINDYRNGILHGLYALHPDGTLWLHTGRTDATRRKHKSFKLDPQLIRDWSSEAFNLARKIQVPHLGADPHNPCDIVLPLALLRKPPRTDSPA